MRRIGCLLVAAIMMMAMAACSAPAGSSDPESGGTEASLQAKVKPQPVDASASIEETVVLDQDGLKVTAKSINFERNNLKICLNFENNSGQKVTFYVNTRPSNCLVINGYSLDFGRFIQELDDGKSANGDIVVSPTDLQLLGLSNVGEITLSFFVEGADRSLSFESAPVTIPTSLADKVDTSADTYRQVVEGSTFLADNNMDLKYRDNAPAFELGDVRIADVLMANNVDGDQVVLLEFENASAQGVTVRIKETSGDGLRLCGGLWDSIGIAPNTRAVVGLDYTAMLDHEVRGSLGVGNFHHVTFVVEVLDGKGNTVVPDTVCTIDFPGESEQVLSGETVYEGNGIAVQMLGFAEDYFDFSEDMHILLLVENTGAEEVSVDIADDSLSVGSVMADELSYSVSLPAGSKDVLNVEMDGDSLAAANIGSLADIQRAEFTLEIRNRSSKVVAEPTIVLENGQ